jgi:tRNA U55 pseudouridine synthase TruB
MLKIQDLKLRISDCAFCVPPELTFARSPKTSARKLGTGAHLAELRRTKAGKFAIEKAVTLEQLEEIVAAETLETVLISMNEAVSHLAEIRLSAEEIGKIKNGVKLERDLAETKNETVLRLTDEGKICWQSVFTTRRKKPCSRNWFWCKM